MIGTNIGHYHIAELLGTGGMGEVYAAEDTRLGRRVALKVRSRDLAMDADRRERFEREARAVAALNHPNTTTGAAGLAAISDDGRYVAYVITEDGRSGLWLRQVATTSNVAIVPAADVRFHGVTFSPDSNYVYYSFYPAGEMAGSLWQVPVLGGKPRRILENVDG